MSIINHKLPWLQFIQIKQYFLLKNINWMKIQICNNKIFNYYPIQKAINQYKNVQKKNIKLTLHNLHD